MQLQTLTKRLSKHKLALIALALLGAVLAMGGTLFMKLEYQTTSRFIVIQEQRFSDAFTQSKSSEYVSGILARVVSTDSFRDAVFAKYDYLTGLFPESKDETRKAWNKAVSVEPLKDTGILNISAYNVDRTAAEAIVFAVGDTLTNNVKEYLGKGAAVEIKPIDGPITTDYPARPSFVNNAIAGFAIGLLLGIVLFGFRESRRREIVGQALPASLPPQPVRKAPVPPMPIKKSRTMPRPRPDADKQATFSKQEFERWLTKPPAKS
jgi:capsular polysaccharide biosynthesis protein